MWRVKLDQGRVSSPRVYTLIPSSQPPETLEKLEDGTFRRLGGGRGGIAIQRMSSFSLAGWKSAGDPQLTGLHPACQHWLRG